MRPRGTTTRSTAIARKCAACSPPSKRRLGVVPFLGGQSYSIADIATFPWARGVGTFLGKPAEAEYPKLMAWVATIDRRPAVARALAAVDGVRAKTTAFDKAGDEAKDRLFGRGRHAA